MGNVKIGEAAREIGVPVHVLRHWDDVGAVVPDRSPSGHRDYSADHLLRLRALRACQDVGISLADIRQILHRGKPERTGVIRQHLSRIRIQQARLNTAERFPVHVIGCTHNLLIRCPECTDYGDNTSPTESVPLPKAVRDELARNGEFDHGPKHQR